MLFDRWDDITGPLKDEVDAFNVALAEHRGPRQKICFVSAAELPDNNSALLPGRALMMVSSQRRFRGLYITCAVLFLVSLPWVIGFWGFGRGINAVGGVDVPYMILIVLAPVCLVFGIPAYICSKKALLFLKEDFKTVYLTGAGKYLTRRRFAYSDILYADVGYITRADSDASTRSDWAIMFKFYNKRQNMASLKLCEFDYRDLEKKMLFWLRNLSWQQI